MRHHYGRTVTLDSGLFLEANPDVLVALVPRVGSLDQKKIRQGLANDEIAHEITDVQEGQIYAQGARRQGPILNRFQSEMAAK